MLTLIADNGTGLDLAPDFGIAIEVNSPLFAPVGELAKSYSYPARIPATPRNQLQLSFANRPEVRTWPSANRTLSYNGMPLLRGKLDISEATDQDYEVTLSVSAGIPFLSKTLQELQQPLLATGIGSPLNPIARITPQMRFDNNGSPITVNTGPSFDDDYPLPNVRSILEELIVLEGWTIDFQWNPTLDKLYLFTGRQFFFLDGFFVVETSFIFPSGMTYAGLLDVLQESFDLVYTYNTLEKKLTIRQGFSVLGDDTTVSYRPIRGWGKKQYPQATLRFAYESPDSMISELETPAVQQAYRALYADFGTGEEEITMPFLFMPDYSTNLPHYAGRTPGETAPDDVILTFGNEAATDTASYIFGVGLSLKLSELVPWYWGTRLAAFTNSYTIKKTYLLTPLELSQFNPLRKIYDDGVIYLPKRLRVQVPNRRVEYLKCEIEMISL